MLAPMQQFPHYSMRLCLVLSTNLALYKFLFVFCCICILLNEAGALTNPKGMILNWCSPLGVTKAVMLYPLLSLGLANSLWRRQTWKNIGPFPTLKRFVLVVAWAQGQTL